MASYVVTGSSQELGFAFLEHLSKTPSNKVIGLARSKAPLQAKLKSAVSQMLLCSKQMLGIWRHLTKEPAEIVFWSAPEAIANIIGGGLDVLINNAGLVSDVSVFKALSDLSVSPLIRKGNTKKVVNISTGMADLDLTNDTGIEAAGPYSASKAAANVVIAKYNAAHKDEDILFLSISPGYVATERNLEATGNDAKIAQEMGAKFAIYAPHFTRMLTTEESISAILDVMDQKSVASGDGAKFFSHKGNQEWL